MTRLTSRLFALQSLTRQRFDLQPFTRQLFVFQPFDSQPFAPRSFTRRRFAVRLPVVRLLSICLLLSPALAAAHAQDLDEITIAGRVADERGASIVGAKVSAVLDATGAPRTTRTDADGRFRLVELAPGSYTVSVSSEGFAAETRADISALAGRSVRLDFTLRPASVTAEQTVTAATDTAAIDTTRTVTGGTLTRREIEELPLPSRAPLDLVLVLTGVTEEPLATRDAAEDRDPNSRAAARHSQTPEEAGAFALAGGAAYSNNVTTDGLDNNDDRAARERFHPRRYLELDSDWGEGLDTSEAKSIGLLKRVSKERLLSER